MTSPAQEMPSVNNQTLTGGPRGRSAHYQLATGLLRAGLSPGKQCAALATSLAERPTVT